MKAILLMGALWAASGMAAAKLPPPDDAAKAKAAETSAKAAWQAKVDGYLLCKAQDKVAARYAKAGAKTAAAKDVKPVAAASAAPATATAASGTPMAMAAKPPPPCQDPGPFAYNPPEQKPLETAGAHSPTGTAASPPSVKPNSAEMAPAKK
ncbi:MAG: hypothetical protein Q8R01_02410 [Ramlibacter sp.]|nr:hypothetical protein [Ramlibacter sp.]